MDRTRNDYERYLRNSIARPDYINKERVKKLIRENKISEFISDITIYRDILKESITRDSTNKYINIIEEYEYDKSFKYAVLYKFTDINFGTLISNLKANSKINSGDVDYISDELELPSLIEYDDSFDLKFSFITTEDNTDTEYTTGYKYPIIITLFKESGLMLYKYDGLVKEQYDNNGYIDLVGKINSWVRNNIQEFYHEVNLFPIFKQIVKDMKHNPNNYVNMSPNFEKLDDEFNGGLELKADKKESMSFVDGLLEIAKSHSDELLNEMIDYIDGYKEKGEYRRIGIRWNNKFGTSGQLSKVIVILRKVYSSINLGRPQFIHLHYTYNQGLNRERINYVIKYLSDII